MLEVQKSVKAYYTKASEGLKEGQSAAGSWLEGWEGTAMEFELGRALITWIRELYSGALYTINAVAPEERLQDILGYGRPTSKPPRSKGWYRFPLCRWAREQWSVYKSEALGLRGYLPRVVKADPEAGELELAIPLPGQARSLEHLADGFHPDNLIAIRNRVLPFFTLPPERGTIDGCQMSEEMGRVSETVGAWVGSIPPPENQSELEAEFANVLHTLHGYKATAFGKTWPYESEPHVFPVVVL